MRTTSPTVVNGRVHMTTPSVTCHPARPVASSGARRFITERWLFDLLVLALAGLLAGAAAVYGLSVVSTGMPTLNRPTTDHSMVGDHEARAGGFGVPTDRLRRHETKR
jgi:hypothetical protein